MRHPLLALAFLQLLSGCGGGAQSNQTTLASPQTRACDHAVEQATVAWQAYAADLRVEAIEAWTLGAAGYQDATAELVSGDVGDGPLARAKRVAVRGAVGEAASAAERAEMSLDDAIDASVDHAELVERFDGLEGQAREAFEEARDAYERALRNVMNGSASISAAAALAPERANEAVDRAVDIERSATRLGDSGRVSIDADDDSDSYGRADELTQRAAVTCDFPAAQLARR